MLLQWGKEEHPVGGRKQDVSSQAIFLFFYKYNEKSQQTVKNKIIEK